MAKETGLSDQLQKAITQQVNRDNQALQQGLAKLNADFEKKRQEYGDTPTEEQLNELKQLQNFIAMQKGQGEQRIKQNQYMLQQRMGATLREQVRPIAMEIAKEQGYAIVLEHSPTVLAFSEKINISQEVVIRMNEQKSSGKSKPTPGDTGTSNSDNSKPPVLEGNGANLDVLTNPGGGNSAKEKTGKATKEKVKEKTEGIGTEKKASDQADLKKSETDSESSSEEKANKPDTNDKNDSEKSDGKAEAESDQTDASKD